MADRHGKLTVWDWCRVAIAMPFYGLAVAICLLRCRLGVHEWFWRERLRVRCYDWGAWQCMFCETIKVKP